MSRGSTRKWVVIAAASALMIFAGATLALNVSGATQETGLTCSKAADQAAEALDGITTVEADKDLSANEKTAKVDELTAKANEAGKYWEDHDCKKAEEDSDEEATTTTTAADTPDTPTGTPGDPCVGNQCNDSPVLSEAQSWTALVRAVDAQPNGGQWYWDKLQAFNGISEADARRAAELEQSNPNWVSRFILASNTPKSDGEAKAELKDQGFKNVDQMAVVRVNGFINTRGVPDNRMEAFEDGKSQVRVSLGLPVDWNDLSKGLQSDRGVLTMCGNGWKVKSESPAPTPAPPATPTPAPAPAPTAPPVTAPPPTAPPTTATPTTAPPQTTTTVLTCPPGSYPKDGKCETPPTSEE